MDKQAQIRQTVSSVYAQAISPEIDKDKKQNEITQLAGYEEEELKELPDEAVTNSFGCGNPIAMSGIRKGDVVLDLGSGAGLDLLLAAERVGPEGRVIGVDMTDEMIALANRNIASSGYSNIEVRKGIIEDLPVSPNSVDWVISNCVISLSPDKEKVFSEIFRVLKPSGQMMISDIVVNGFVTWLLKILSISKLLYSACVGGAISEKKYLIELRGAGFTDVEVRERLVYEASQIRAFLTDSNTPGIQKLMKSITGKILVKLIGIVAGKVWSAKFFAQKPENLV